MAENTKTEKNEEKVQIGNLYLYKCSDERILPTYTPTIEVLQKQKSFTIDEGSGNVHMFPFDINIAELCSWIIKEKRKNILNCIKELVDNNEVKNISYEKYKGDGRGVKIADETPYQEIAKSLFAYLQVNGKSKAYDLIFNRFFFDQNNRVNCILLRFQVEMYDNSSVNYLNPNKRENPPFTKDYPHTSDDGKGNKCYHNLNVDIHSDAETIAKKFLKFVLKKEKEEEEKRKKAQQTKAENIKG